MVAIGVEVLDRTRGHAAVHRRLRHRRRHAGDEPRIERARNEVVGAERGRRLAIASATISDGSARASSASECTAASFIASLIVLAPQSSAPRKRNGKHSELLTWFG